MTKKNILSVLALLLTIATSAQVEIYPESSNFDFSKFKPFKAEYVQMGMEMLVSSTISMDNETYNVSMTMPDMTNQSRIITDVIGMNINDGSFKYRNFHLLMPSRAYVQSEKIDTKLNLSISNAEKVDKIDFETNGKGYFDGTFAYWLLSGVNLTKTSSFKINTWKYTPAGLSVSLSPEFKHEGSITLSIDDKDYICSKISLEPSPGVKMICYISKSAPYLIKQEYIQGDADAMTIIELKKVYQ